MRTSRLSLAAITALGITTASLSAGELLDIALPDNQWKMIGVNGVFTGEMTALDTPTATGYENDDKLTIGANGEVNDNLFTKLTEEGKTDSMVSFKVVDSDLGSEPTSAKMTISTDGKNYDATAAVKTMYVSANGTGYGDIHILYQADFEGDTFELSISYGTDTKSYTGTFQSSSTAANPGKLTLVEGNTQTIKIEDAIDTNLSNNPGIIDSLSSKEDFVASKNKDGFVASDSLKIFNFDAGSNAWKSYTKSGTTTGSGDFSEFEPGKSYWVKLTDGDHDETGAAILGTGGINSNTYQSFKDNKYLSAGWNMLSFNDGALREASTGLIVEFDATNILSDNKFKIADAYGYQGIDITLTEKDDNVAEIAKTITLAMNSAKNSGKLSKGFGFVAVGAKDNSGNDRVVMLSDRQFRIYDTNTSGSIVKSIRTIADQDPFYLGSSSFTAISDLNILGASSRYGEFSLIVTPNDTGSGSRAGGVGSVQVNNNSAVDINNSSLQNTAKAIKNDKSIDNTIELDLDYDNVTESILLVDKDDRFYVKDSVFTRVYELNSTDKNGSTINLYFDGNETALSFKLDVASDESNLSQSVKSVLTAGTHQSTHVLTTMDANVTIDNEDNNSLIAFTDNIDYKNFRLIDDPSRDILTPSTSDSNLTTGAIKEVYSIENLAKAVWTESEKTYKLVFHPSISSDTDKNDTNLTFVIGYGGIEYNVSILSAIDEGNKSTDITQTIFDLNITDFKALDSIDVNLSTSDGNITVVDYNDTNVSMSISAEWDVLAGSTGTDGTRTAQITGYVLQTAINTHDFGDGNATDDSTTDDRTKTPLKALRIRQGGDTIYISVPGCDTDVNDFNITEDNDTNSMLTITAPENNGSCKINSIPNLTGDLKYNPVYAQDFQVDTSAPLFRLRSTGYKVQKVLSPVENGSGSISWSYIDLTKNSSQWFNPVDNYTLFRTDRERGYWVYLEEVEDANIVIGGDADSGTFSFKPMYKHSFNNDANVTNGLKSYSMLVSSSITTEISGLEQSAGGNSNVQVMINGNVIPMSKTGNLYNADATVDGLKALPEGELPIDVRVYDEAGNYLTKTMTYLDNKKPTTPTLGDDSTLAATKFSSTDGDGENATGIGAYFVYSGDINESNLSQNLVAKVFNGETTIYKNSDGVETSKESGDSINLCTVSGGKTDEFKVETGWKVFAIDGGTDKTNSGVVDYNLVSDLFSIGDDLKTTTVEEGWIPIYKGTSILSAGGDTGNEIDAIPTNYDLTCTASATEATVDNGVSLHSVNGAKVAIAYRAGKTNLSNASGVGSIITTYVSDASKNLARITFDGNSYPLDDNNTVAIELGSVIYTTNWSDLNNSGNGYPTTSTTFELNDTTKVTKTAFPGLTIK